MVRPQWKWEWNLNTIVILMGFAAGIAAWGATWARLSDGPANNRASIAKLDTRLSQQESGSRILDNHEYRITNLEKQTGESASAMRAVENTLNSLATDMRVTREILQRIEASQASPSSRSP